MNTPRLTGNRCRCPACGDFFNSEKAFDRHRAGAYPSSRRCLSPSEMAKRGMTVNSGGFWITETRRQNRVKTVASQIPAVLLEAPLGHQGVSV